MSPHAVRGTGTRHCWNSGKREGKEGGRRTAWAVSCHTMKRKRTPHVRTSHYAKLHVQSTSMWNSNTCAYVLRLLTSRGTQALFVVNSCGTQALIVINSTKLHLTACSSKVINWMLRLGGLNPSWTSLMLLWKSNINCCHCLLCSGHGGREREIRRWMRLVVIGGLYVRNGVWWNSFLCRIPGGNVQQNHEPHCKLQKIKIVILFKSCSTVSIHIHVYCDQS